MQEVKIYNSLSKEKEIFKPLNASNIGIYVCGPTVYSEVHLGNCRTFISFDVVVRYLKFIGYDVRYVRNITDAGHLENDADFGEDKIMFFFSCSFNRLSFPFELASGFWGFP